MLRLVLFGGVDDEKPDRLGDLDCREADAGGVMHRFDHVVDQPRQRIVDALDRLADEPEFRVGQGDDVAKGHAGLEDGQRSNGQPDNATQTGGERVPTKGGGAHVRAFRRGRSDLMTSSLLC